LRDAIGRDWQCGTLQVDMNLPERFDINYVDENGNRDKRPVMLHRAVLGSFERFIGILIEQYAGALPTWLAPHQAAILNITEKQTEYCLKVEETLRSKGFRVISDLRNEKIGFKIREHTLQKIPYLLVVGDKEVESEAVSVRKRGGEDIGAMPMVEFLDLLGRDINQFGRDDSGLQK
jgi:threonyl-tRNA synthetase